MIYCVEDESGIRNMMVYTLEAAGLKAKGLEDGAALYAALKEQIPSLIILDIMLPDEDGISILKKLRMQSSTQRVPIIMATAKSSEYDKVVGLDSGADDYLVKPFGMMEMVSRVRAVMRRSAQEEVPAIQLGKLYLNPSAHVVMVDGESIELTYKEFEMLYMLMSNPGRVFTRQQFLTCIWDQDYDGETRTVDVHIRNLRQKLGSCGNYINTVRGVGYRMEVSE
mgnify:CR=1 FL=1